MPPLLILGGISGAGMMTYLEAYRPLFMALTFGLLAGAFYMTYRPGASRFANSKFMTFNKYMLWGVLAFSIVMLFFPQAVMGLFTTTNKVTADMERTEIRIEGMT